MRRISSTLVLLALVLGLVLGIAAACTSDDDPPQVLEEPTTDDSLGTTDDSLVDATDDSTAAPAQGSTPVSVFELSVGDCFNHESFDDEDVEGRLDQAELVQCFDPHDAEVYAIVRYPEAEGTTFPGRTAVQDFADEECFGRFEAFVGVPYEESALEIASLWPTNASWDEGDREVACVVFHVDHEDLEGTMDGAEI